MEIKISLLMYGAILCWYLGYQTSKWANLGRFEWSLLDVPFIVIIVLFLIDIFRTNNA